MGFLKVVALYFSTLVICFGIDLIWLALMNSRFYKPQLAGLMSDQVNWIPGILFYILFVIGLLLLVVLPGVDNGSWIRVMLLGGLLGMVAYATYDLSNLATIKNWPVAVTIIDIIWGTVFSSIVASVSYFIAKAIS